MEDNQEDLVRVKELLRHSGEFIAYFELSDTKMMQWREEIKQQALQLHSYSQKLQTELAAVHDLLSQSGIARFRITAEQALSQGENQLQLMNNSCEQFARHLKQHHHQFELLTKQCLVTIEKHVEKKMAEIAFQLAQYDVTHFHRIAHESCDHVERAAHDAIRKSDKLLHKVSVKCALFTVVTTIISTFIVVLYLSGELPWDVHHKAIKERNAGKALLQAWPGLTLEERAKVLEAVEDHGNLKKL